MELGREDLERVDAGGMHKVYERWPEMAADAYQSQVEGDVPEVDHIVFAGMGGSGTVGDVLGAVLSGTSVHVSHAKGYLLPRTADHETLVVATSVSGNTEEALAVLGAAKDAGCRVLAASSGGRMKEFCDTNGIDHRVIPTVHSPRASLAAYLYSMIRILGPALRIGVEDVNESVRLMRGVRDACSAENLTGDNRALDLAVWLQGIPVIYYPAGLGAAAIRFKNCLQENAKRHAMAEDVIEACHNGIVPWEGKSGCQPVLLRGADDHPKTKERYDIIEEYLRGRTEYRVVRSVSGGILAKIACMIYELDYASIYLAVLSGIDPTPVAAVDHIKARMRDDSQENS